MIFSDFKENLVNRNRIFADDNIHEIKRKMELILNIGNRINRSLMVDDVLKLVLRNALDVSKAERGFIVLKNKSGFLEFKLSLDCNGQILSLPSFDNICTSIIEEVFYTNQSRFIEFAQSDYLSIHSRSIHELELQTIACSPLIAGSNKIGVIYVDSKIPRKIKIKEITNTFEILANQATIAINNAQLYEEQHSSIIKLKSINTELTKAKEEAEKSNKLKLEFLAQMSHEIRSPLNVILNFISLIKEEAKTVMNEEYLDYFNDIENASNRIIRTIGLILNMAELQVGAFENNPQKIDIYDDILRGMVNGYKSLAKQKNLDLELIAEIEQPDIFADSYCVQQIFQNLIDNAIKYTKTGKISVRVYENENEKIIVEVRDTGIGMSEDYLSQIFNPFTQEEQGYTRRFDGNGLGLALVKKYIELNNSAISVESKKGVGTVFRTIFNKYDESLISIESNYKINL